MYHGTTYIHKIFTSVNKYTAKILYGRGSQLQEQLYNQLYFVTLYIGHETFIV